MTGAEFRQDADPGFRQPRQARKGRGTGDVPLALLAAGRTSRLDASAWQNPEMETPSDLDLPDDAISIGQAAKLVRCHKSAVYRWALKGVIPYWRRGPGRRLLVSRADVLARLEKGAPTAAVKPIVPTAREKSARRQRNKTILGRYGLI